MKSDPKPRSDGWPESIHERPERAMLREARELMKDQAHMRVLSVDDDPLLNEGITAVINNQSDMQLVAQATSGSDAKDSMPDGAVKHLRVVAHAVRDEATRGTDYVGAVTDLTAVKESRL